MIFTDSAKDCRIRFFCLTFPGDCAIIGSNFKEGKLQIFMFYRLTVVEFPEKDGISIPRICTLSSDAHLYKEGLPTKYNDRFRD